jgi:repressor LexA
MLTAKQNELLRFIHERLENNGVSPSFEEMKEALDLKSKSGVHRLIGALEERGFIRRLANRARALEVMKMPEGGSTRDIGSRGLAQNGPQTGNQTDNIVQLTPAIAAKSAQAHLPVAANDVIEIPLHGRIAAGVPIEAMEGQSSLSVPMALLGAGEHYALEVSGDSMIEAGILDGDYALIRKTNTARDGEIVVALVRDEEATLKYLRRDGAQIRLDPANAAYDPQYYTPHDVQIQGKLAGLLRRYN